MSDHDQAHAKHPRLLELEELVRDGQIDTIVVAITDMQGRLMGKRVQGQAFLDGVISHGAHFCTYLLGHGHGDEHARGLQADELGDRLRRLDRRAGLGPAADPALAAGHGHGPRRRGRRGDRPRDPDRAADDPQAPGRAGGRRRLRAEGRLRVRVLRAQGLVGGAGRARLAGPAHVRPLQRGLPPPPGHQGRAAPSAAAQPDDRGRRAHRVQQGRGRQRPARGQHPLRPCPRPRPTGASCSSTAPRRSPTSTAGASPSWPSPITTGRGRRGTST